MWAQIIIDKKPFFIKTRCKNKQWKIVLVNLEEIWIENLSYKEAIEKCQSSKSFIYFKLWNPLLDVDDFNLDEIINEILKNIMDHVVFVSVNEIKLEKEIEGGVFKFSINLTKGNLQDIWAEIIKPLCTNAHELQRQNEIIVKEIKKKDEEITEYKLNGKLLRKIETERFDDNLFNSTKINAETKNLFSMFRSLMNQNDHSNMEKLSNSDDNQTKNIERVKDKKHHTNNDVEAISIDKNYGIDDNNEKRKVFITSETEVVKITNEVPKSTSPKVNLDFSKSKKLDKQPKESTSKKRPRKELSHFIS
ncbi:uncharacterized protein [Chelonus insularis]|uniref:uncharacterized protein isoform X2 n=1 Tax=Chelonus insularis TaxID=460826 RepID=UPI00158CECDD|nr:uncharacterized protein LOC118074746 isoform X2 [Chelonus insularis]